MGRMAWGATTPRVCLGSVAIGKRLWRSRAVEKSQSRLSHRAWKSRPKRGIPTSPQPRRRRVINRQPDNSLATKTGPFNLLRTDLLALNVLVTKALATRPEITTARDLHKWSLYIKRNLGILCGSWNR